MSRWTKLLGRLHDNLFFRPRLESSLRGDRLRRPDRQRTRARLFAEEFEARLVPTLAVPFAATFTASMSGASIASLPDATIDITSSTDIANFPSGGGELYVETSNGVATIKYTSTTTSDPE